MYLGLDLGTTGMKGVVLDEAQEVLAQAHAGLTVSRPKDGWSEQDPEAWVDATRSVLSDLARDADLAGVEGIGLSGQMHGATLVGADDRAIRPSILWNDTRSHQEAARLDADPAFPGHLRQHRLSRLHGTEACLASRRMNPMPSGAPPRSCSRKDYLRLWLTGEHVSEMSDAAGNELARHGRAGLVRLASREDRPHARPHSPASSRVRRSRAGCARISPRHSGFGPGSLWQGVAATTRPLA